MKHPFAFLITMSTQATSRLTALLQPLVSVAILSLTALGGMSISEHVRAQDNLATVTPLYNFSTAPNASKLVEDSAGNFYGTQSPSGGLNQVFRLSPAGIFTSLYLFEGASGTGPQSLIMGTDGNLYGVATSGGTVDTGTGGGTVYRLSLTGEFALLHTFNGTDGSGPDNVIQGADGNLYGTTAGGGTNNAGTVFRITLTGEFTSLYSFAGGQSSSAPVGIVQGDDGNLYGTTTAGGNAGTMYGAIISDGTIFRLTLAGEFTLLYSFDTGSYGAYPGLLTQGNDGNFYGEYLAPVRQTSLEAYKITPAGEFTKLAVLASSFLSETSVALTLGGDGNFYTPDNAYGVAVRGAIVQLTPAGQVTPLYSANTNEGGTYLVGAGPLLLGNDGSFYGVASSTLYRLTLLPLSALVPVITTSSLPASEQGVAYSYQVAAIPAAEVFSATGLPSGLTISTGGIISGTPTVSGTSQVAVSAVNRAGTGTATFTLYLAGLSPVITSASTAAVGVGQPFTYQITSDTPGASFGASNLPLGLNVSAAGLISGTVATPGTYNVTLEAANQLSNYTTAPLTLTVSATPAFFTGEVPLTNGVYYLAFTNGNPFGYYSFLSDPHYLYHFDLGYEYVFDAADGHAGVYLYDFKSGDFFYTSPIFPFPYLYDFNLNAVLYYYPDPNNPGRYNTNGMRYFYDFAAGKVITK